MDRDDIGKKGEDVACTFLERKGHTILDRNFRMKFGEIDVISEKQGKTYFSEVKTVAQENDTQTRLYGAEERVNRSKIKKLSRVIQYYLSSKFENKEPEWEFWVVTVVFNLEKKTATVKVIPEVLGS